ncbi:MAG: E3 ubiquitin-protein ligase COP1-like [Amphiamblys sp. WSBS2006]|nr:MAG: E3 ubiquitin-protein ligase COP1-like [Amphiamblys sp. WSBS2006]
MTPENTTNDFIKILHKKKTEEIEDTHRKLAQIQKDLSPVRQNSQLPLLLDILDELERFYLQNTKADLENTIRKILQTKKVSVAGSLQGATLTNERRVVSILEPNKENTHLVVGGVSRKIKIYAVGAMLDTETGFHFPEKTLNGKAKITCAKWLNRGSVCSGDYEGVLAVWDLAKERRLRTMEEHGERIWSVDSKDNSPLLLSGSDDFRVKLWSEKEKSSVETLTAPANVCSVRFVDEFCFAYGCADSRAYLHDTRNTSSPVSVLVGHKKAVSYCCCMDPKTLATASSDGTLIRWALDGREQISPEKTYTGHCNEKNFVGLSVTPELLATGSETNTVYFYHKNVSAPVSHYAFPGTDPLTGIETGRNTPREDFVTAVAWLPDWSALLCSNSRGQTKSLKFSG